MRQQDANRELLVQFLRDEEARRAECFSWDFNRILTAGKCGSRGCAIGAARMLGLIGPYDRSLALAIVVGLPELAANIFLDPEEYGKPRNEDVTAAMVADKIEEVAAGAKP